MLAAIFSFDVEDERLGLRLCDKLEVSLSGPESGLFRFVVRCYLRRQMLKDAEWDKSMASAFVELGLELNPVEPERVEEALHDIHAHHHSQSHTGKDHEAHIHLHGAQRQLWLRAGDYLPG